MKTLLFSFFLFAVTNSLFSQVKFLEEGKKPGTGSLEDLGWLVGYWTGTGLSGTCDETWMPAADGHMIGTFRFWNKGKLVFSEFMNMVQEGDTFYLKLKHFNPDLSGWEEKEEWTIFRLVETGENTIWFHGFTMKRVGDEMQLWLELEENGEKTTMEFSYTKQKQLGY
ncbi:DUF6265 family protein [Algoriphagus pacificus]|uniref:DUF6265 domain-containing protein n=1 Tax=Algoriphagus pacificus TaxID=2811234 RepID=A0ABS3CF06_9BACT|nr:DUF6265 family protein [Algoriphagus pacificus]MBN7815692.1 hypothetical protein [Algoriphagus pacificus]